MFFDPRVHPTALSDQDLETLQIFGVRTVVAVADTTAHPHTPDGIFRHFDHLMQRQLPRMERAGLQVFAALGVHGAVLPRRGLSDILEALPRYFRDPRVRAVGQLGFLKGDEREQEALLAQLTLASDFHLAALISAPTRQKERQTAKLLDALQSTLLEPQRILLDGASTRTVRGIREWGYWAGLSLHPEHLSVEQAVTLVKALGVERLLLDTGAGDGSSDILSLGRAAHRMRKAGLSNKVVRKVTCDNARMWLFEQANAVPQKKAR